MSRARAAQSGAPFRRGTFAGAGVCEGPGSAAHHYAALVLRCARDTRKLARTLWPGNERPMINYLIAMATFGAIYAMLALALNVMWGMAGMVNLGIVGFYAFGAYVSALLTTKAGAPIALGFAAAIAGTAVMAALTTLGLTRLRDDYLAIVTLGFAEVVRIVAENEIWLTRGTDGISGIPQPLKSLLGPDFNLAYLAFCLVLLALVLFVLERVRTAPFGRVLRAIREDAQIAAFAGKDVLQFKVKAFALGGAVAGLAGALYAHYSSYIVPEIYVPLLTIYIFLALTAGGIGNNWGAVVGAFVVVFCLEFDALPDRRHPLAVRRAARGAARVPGRVRAAPGAVLPSARASSRAAAATHEQVASRSRKLRPLRRPTTAPRGAQHAALRDRLHRGGP